jgi:RNA polymerase sigma-70 factor (sigma-E family)
MSGRSANLFAAQPFGRATRPWSMPSWDAPPSFVEYVRTRHAELLRFAHVLCGDPHLAADLVQDALERVGISWHRIQRQDDPEGYLRRTIVHRYVSRWRALRRERLVAELPERQHVDVEPADGELWTLLTTLPPRQRAVVVLRFYQDLSAAQIAEVMGCTVGTVKSNGSRALAKLRAGLSSRTNISTRDGGS